MTSLRTLLFMASLHQFACAAYGFIRPTLSSYRCAQGACREALSLKAAPQSSEWRERYESLTQPRWDQLLDELETDYDLAEEVWTELTGLGVAHSIHAYCQDHGLKSADGPLWIACGPSMTGQVGLMAIRHLSSSFGYDPVVVTARKRPRVWPELDMLRTWKPERVVLSLDDVMRDEDATSVTPLAVIDAVEGLDGEVTTAEMQQWASFLGRLSCPVISLDVPVGWAEGSTEERAYVPSALISLIVPKAITDDYEGLRYLAGRVLPPSLEKAYNLKLPAYEGTEQFVRLWHEAEPDHATATGIAAKSEKEGDTLVWLTASSTSEARSIAAHLVEKGLAKRVSVMPGMVETFGGRGFADDGAVREAGMVAVVQMGKEGQVRDAVARFVMGTGVGGGGDSDDEGDVPVRGIGSSLAALGMASGWRASMSAPQEGDDENEEDDDMHSSLLGW